MKARCEEVLCSARGRPVEQQRDIKPGRAILVDFKSLLFHNRAVVSVSCFSALRCISIDRVSGDREHRLGVRVYVLDHHGNILLCDSSIHHRLEHYKQADIS
jgi:hypothetical protein